MILTENSARGKNEGILQIRQLHGRPVIDHIELAKAPRELAFMEVLSSRMLHIGAGPLQAVSLQPLIAYTTVTGSELGYLGHDLGRVIIAKLVLKAHVGR